MLQKRCFISYLLLLPLILTCGAVFSQDIIKKLNGEDIPAVLLEINELQIRYKLYPDTIGPDQIIDKKEVRLIMLRNGHNQIISAETRMTPVDPLPRNLPVEFRRIGYVHGLDMVLARISLSYEGISPDKRRGFVFGALYGFVFKRIELHMQRNWYTQPWKDFRYYAGPKLSTGRTPFTTAHSNGFWWYVPGNYITLSFQNGFTFDHSKLIRLSFGSGIGLRYFSDVSRGLYAKYRNQTISNPNKKLVMLHVNFSLNLGFKF